jgi:hypothetical protein
MTIAPPITVPADLLPGLLREGVACLLPDGRRVFVRYFARRVVDIGHHREGLPVAPGQLGVDISHHTGWDAAVDALARTFWPDMAPHERAGFYHDGVGWSLVLRRAGYTPHDGYMVWPRLDLPGADEPTEALRLVLLHESKR